MVVQKAHLREVLWFLVVLVLVRAPVVRVFEVARRLPVALVV